MANHHAAGGTQNALPQSLHFDEQFENPYNFVPAPPRSREHPTLGDALPAGHHRYLPGLWSGRISVELTTVTPLLIPDQPTVDANGHKTFGVRTDEDGAPYLPPTSIKGALRAAYEAVTNSRMGVWSGAHDSRLALRQPADSSLELIPVRIVSKPYQGKACLFAIEHEALPLRFYSTTAADRHRGTDRFADRYTNVEEGDTLPQHGDCVQRDSHSGALAWVDEKEPVVRGWRRGYAVINGPNIKDKINERLFLEKAGPREFVLTSQIKKQWDELIANYQKLHVDELEKRRRAGHGAGDFLGATPGQTAWSRHVHDAPSTMLKHGLLCYAKLTDRNELAALYPVLISRELYAAAPTSLLDESVQPPTKMSELSPADRVFGWVGKGAAGQYKGQLRIGATRCLDRADAIEPVGDAQGVALAILGAPKPAQARFYGAKDRQGTPYPQGTAKAEMYRPEHGLRGRKFYPHHKMQTRAEGYWDRSAQPPGLSGQPALRKPYREWRMPEQAAKQRTDQNRSITAWVRPGARFRFDLQLTNVSSVELGALLWLLSLDDDCCLRLGGGKPLGFGSIRLRVVEGDGLDLCDGEAIRSSYASFGSGAASGRCLRSRQDAAGLITAYQKALAESIGSPDVPFDRLPISKAFLNAARGGRLPVRYPRTQLAPNPEGENFKWFVANETWSKTRHERYSLPALDEPERGLWVLK